MTANERKVLKLVEEWMDAKKPICEITSETIRSLNLSKEEKFNYLTPQLTKDVYYSPFVHIALGIGLANDECLYSVLEAVYAMVFTPSPTGYCEGVDLASACTSRDNFIVRFIKRMVAEKGCVSAGPKRRRQVSHQRKVLKKLIMASLHNLLDLIELANTSDDTEAVVKAFTQSPDEGGMFLVGELTAQEIINVLTKLSIISNQRHAHNVLLATGTNTCKRLGKLGIKSESARSDLVDFLCSRLQLQKDKAENATCESLRMKYCKREFWDTVGGEHNIYTMNDGSLVAFDVEGGRADVEVPRWTTEEPSSGFVGIRWWRPEYVREYNDQLKGALRLTNKNK